MSSPAMNYIDDKDLDDAALWAAIDSAAASSLSLSLAPKPRKSTPSPHVQLPKCPRSSPDLQGPAKQPKSARFTSPLSLAKVRVSSPPVYGSPDSRIIAVSDFKRSGSSNVKFHDEDRDDSAVMHCLSGRFPTVSLFKDYQNAAMAILEKSDYTMISGHPFIKKTGWRKISCYFNMSYEIRDKTIEFDEDRNVIRAEFVVRAFMQGGRFSDGWGSCERREKRFSKPNHDIPSTAETRAKNKACQDLLGIGEYRPGASHAH